MFITSEHNIDEWCIHGVYVVFCFPSISTCSKYIDQMPAQVLQSVLIHVAGEVPLQTLLYMNTVLRVVHFLPPTHNLTKTRSNCCALN